MRTAYTAYYDYYSIFYLRNIGMIAASNSFFWLNHTGFFINTSYDFYLSSVPTAYLTQVTMGSGGLLNHNSNVITN